MKLHEITINKHIQKQTQTKKMQSVQLRGGIAKNSMFIVVLFDIFIVTFSFLLLAWYKPATIRIVIPTYSNPFIIFLALWLVVSYVMGKYNLQVFKKVLHLNITITLINFIIISIVTILLFALKLSSYSRMIVFGTSFLAYFFELIVFSILYSITKTPPETLKREDVKQEVYIDNRPVELIQPVVKNTKVYTAPKSKTKVELLEKEIGKEVAEYFSEHVNIDEKNVALIATTTPFNVANLNSGIRTIVNLKKVNDMRYINKFFEAVNEKLPDAGMFMGCVETSKQRYKRIGKRFPAFIRQLVIMIDFALNRIIPRLSGLQNLYFNITGGEKRTISKAEVLGRLVSCGFEIIEYKEIHDLTYFVVMKTKEPEYNLSPSYGPIYKMPRIGKGGEIIYVYKFRTMHPFSEYLQDYVLRLNGFSAIGKPADDFRLTKWGKFMRKYWLDELPQLINVLKGEMKLVGIRPLSRRMFQEYPDDVKEMRVKYKPGCIPPYVALLKQGVLASIEAERQYLLEKQKSPIGTDIKYFKMAIYNIITNKIRSA